MNPNVSITQFFLAAALALMGRASEAFEAVAAGRRIDPDFAVSRFRAQARSSNPVYLQQRERIYEGLRKAGVPEG